jgi:hypothetical protein
MLAVKKFRVYRIGTVVKFQVLTAASMNMTNFWDAAP